MPIDASQTHSFPIGQFYKGNVIAVTFILQHRNIALMTFPPQFRGFHQSLLESLCYHMFEWQMVWVLELLTQVLLNYANVFLRLYA